MQIQKITLLVVAAVLIAGCGAQPTTVNTNLTNSNVANTNTSNTVNANTNASVAVAEAAEPDEYSATVTIKLEALGQTQNVALPTISAEVARSGEDRRMVFTMPAGGRVVYLDKAGTNYLVLPDRKQYAELNRESLGFEVRRMLMPEQIVEQARNVQGVRRVGEETYKGRPAIKYQYGAVANTQSQAGQVTTESFLFVDKETGLPLHSETVSRSQSGGNVQGYSGVRIVTDITDIRSTVSPELFAEPTNLEKIESDKVRAQVDMIFNSIAAALTQAMQQMNTTATPPATPVR
jgi:hypothetical protein